jgi:AcrR family transcriptional regulator
MGFMPPDATQTKRRILAAAREEFSLRGLAGARVDRIAEKALANKRSIYVHFGTKEELFDLVVAQSLLELAEAAPFDAARIPEYAGALFDMLQERPDVGRLTTWALLERQQPLDSEVDSYRRKVADIKLAQDQGIIPPHEPVELLAMVLALVTSWANASWSLRALETRNEATSSPSSFRSTMMGAVAAVVRAGAATEASAD